MAEARNNFLGSKMNKDLEQRLVPNNEYRDGQNVMISRSTGDDVGSLENVLGNFSITDFGYAGTRGCAAEIIGYLMDTVGNRVFVFITDYADSSADQLSNFAYSSSTCSIVMRDLDTNSTVKLVDGYWLNFSKTHSVLGVNLIEDFLYWTDNRNQPRKINIKLAESNPSLHYTCEDQISIAKYYPYTAPLLIDDPISSIFMSSPGTSGNYSANQILYLINPLSSGQGARIQVLTVTGGDNIATFKLLDLGGNYTAGLYEVSESADPDGAPYGNALFTITIQTQSTMQDHSSPLLPDDIADNPFYDPYFQGDKDFLKDKFVRFAWRIKFEDNEYSIISPFTQPAFVPSQDGYFITNKQEERTYTSTELNFMVNKVDYVRIVIPSPYKTWADAIDRFKISEIDLLYKQSNLSSVNVVESIKVNGPLFADYLRGDNFLYEYLSQKPYKTLPNKDLLRVYDKAPIRALSQEFAEDAVVYGNYLDKHTPPENLPYFVSADAKWNFTGSGGNGELRKEYQNHTLKQNRTYQVGVVLSDRYGRQSDVILSPPLEESVELPPGSGIYYGDSTITKLFTKKDISEYFKLYCQDQNKFNAFTHV